MKNKTKFAFIVIASSQGEYKRLKKAVLGTWAKDFEGVAPVFFVYGDGKSGEGEKNVNALQTLVPFSSKAFKPISNYEISEINGNDLIFHSVDGWDQILPNTIAALNLILKTNQFDYIIRTNLSSYWDCANTIRMLQELPANNVFAGPLRGSDIRWIEGDAMIFSHDVASMLCENFGLLNSQTIDDLAIAQALIHLGIQPIHVMRPWLKLEIKRLRIRLHGHAENIFFDNVSSSRIRHSSYSNFRCQDRHIIFGKSFRLDSIIMKILRYKLRRGNRSASNLSNY